ncbi:hypothetical protein GCM10027425_25530 [Alteromonas gracilis]
MSVPPMLALALQDVRDHPNGRDAPRTTRRLVVLDGDDSAWEYLRASGVGDAFEAMQHWPEAGTWSLGSLGVGDVVAVDPWSVGGLGGVALVAELVGRDAAVLIVTATELPLPLTQAMTVGAAGVHLKRDGISGLPDALRRVAAGSRVCSSERARALCAGGRDLPMLTPAQHGTLSGFAAGYSAAEIARATHRSIRTVNNHMADIAQAYARIGRHGPGGALWLGRQGRRDGYHLSRALPRELARLDG